MLDVFTNEMPGPSHSGTFEQYTVEREGILLFEFVGFSGVRRSAERTWTQDGDDAFWMYPGSGDDAYTLEHESWRISRIERCGPYSSELYRDGESVDPEHAAEVFRGKICVRKYAGECDVECDAFELYWCEAPPDCE